MLTYEEILIDERVCVLRGIYVHARGVVYDGKSPTQVRVRFDRRTKGNMVANFKPEMLERILVQQEASGGNQPVPSAPDQKEM